MNQNFPQQDFQSVFPSILSAVHLGCIILGPLGDIRLLNSRTESLLGLPSADTLGRSITTLFPSLADDLQEALDSRQTLVAKRIQGSPDGVALDLSLFALEERNGEFCCILQQCPGCSRLSRDLDAQKALSAELDIIIDSSYDGLWICDRGGRVIRINQASERINQVKASEVLGRQMEDLVKEGLFDRSVTVEAIKAGTAVTIIQQLKNGRRILVTGTPVFDANDQLCLVVVNERDVTELQRLQHELEESRALAQRYRSEISSLQNRELQNRQVIVQSPAMRRVFDMAMRVAQVNSTVLIRGESGVGKGLFAKLIHQASAVNAGPFIRVDCGAIPEALLESELFGYEGGAFTGARSAGKPGLFEMADEGTLFLDEIGDLPMPVQVKLLRFMEEHELVRVGGTSARHVQVRILAATNRSLERLIRERKFRKDLFFRLNVVPFLIPPLRERREDIAPLVHLFLGKFNRKFAMDKSLRPQALDCLCQYSFPGNVRELANLLEQMVILIPDKCIAPDHFPNHIRSAAHPMESEPQPEPANLAQALAQVERKMLSQAWKTCGNQRDAAALLGIDQSTFARKAKRYGLRKDAILHHDAIHHHSQ